MLLEPYALVIVHGPIPTHFETGDFPTLLDDIELGLDLTDVDAGPSPGDNAFAFEWIFDLAPGQPIEIHKWKAHGRIIPEPTSAAIALIGLCVFGLIGRRRNG